MALDNKTLVRRYIEGVFGKQHNLPMLDEILSSDFIEYLVAKSTQSKVLSLEAFSIIGGSPEYRQEK